MHAPTMEDRFTYRDSQDMGLRVTEEQVMYAWEAMCRQKAVKLMVDALAIGEHDEYIQAMPALTGNDTVLGHAASGTLG